MRMICLPWPPKISIAASAVGTCGSESYREKQDQMLAMRMAESIQQIFPCCPHEEASAIGRSDIRGAGTG